MRGGSSSNVREGTPVRRSARQAGHSPEPYVPPPPNPPSTEQILRMFEETRNNDLIEILRSVQAMVGHNGNQNGHYSKLSDFQRTKPPSFSQIVDPLDADDWLRTIEKKLEIARTEENDKVPFATHYLEGAAAIWWENAKAMWPADEEITWEKFKDQFRKYHIPTRIMKVKQHEFLALLQGSQSMCEYLQKFNRLARYSLYDVATEERKIDRFLGGLNPQLRCTLSMFDF